MDTITGQARAPEVLGPRAGHHLHFLDHLATVKVRAGEDGAMSVVEFEAPRGFGPPLHRHRHEDEVFVVLDGELAFHHGDDRLVTQAGGVAFLPHGVPHTFQVLSPTARFTCVIGGAGGASPTFDRMVEALGVPTDTPVLPTPVGVDPTRVADVCLEHGIEVVGPPPAPLA
jgi:quercetin dioxygenase-like cupin family protein